MCNVTICCSVAVVIFIGVIYGFVSDPDAIYEYVDAEDNDMGCQKDRCSCDEDVRSKYSCCAINPVIKSQLHKMLEMQEHSKLLKRYPSISPCPNGGAFVSTLSGTGECLCLPNIGSKYLGASVVSVRDTKPYRHPLGTPESDLTNKPVLVLEPNPLVIGKNWHFQGEVGSLVVKLFHPSYISGFAIGHPPKCQIPKGYEKSAPKEFYVLGLYAIDDKEPFFFGNYTHDTDGPGVQVFPVQKCSLEKYQFIEFRFTANQGNPDYTALYMVRIHGDGPPPGQGVKLL